MFRQACICPTIFFCKNQIIFVKDFACICSTRALHCRRPGANIQAHVARHHCLREIESHLFPRRHSHVLPLTKATPGSSFFHFQHIEMLPLKNIIEVMDISETDECKNMFAVRYEATGNSIIDNNRKRPICSCICLEIIIIINDKA